MAKIPRSRSVNLLFIGNSFTQRNNLPELLAELAAVRNLSVTHELISVGGASLRTHWNSGRAANAIATGGYDYVVLQEQSTLPVKNAQRMAENARASLERAEKQLEESRRAAEEALRELKSCEQVVDEARARRDATRGKR